jgi:hypothetical protein
MTWLHPTKQRRAPAGRRIVTLSPSQIRWLGALLLATQLPMLGYVPIWVACLGVLLVALRFVLVERSVKNRDPAPQIIRSWVLGLLALVTAIAIRHSLGYFIGRDPCVAFLFALIGIKFLETRNARDGTLIVCLACLLIVTPFFYSQSLLAAGLAIPAIVLMGGVLQALARPDGLPPLPGGWRSPLAATLRMFAQGVPIAVTLFVLSRASPARCGASPPTTRQTPGSPTAWRRASSASSRSPTQSPSASISIVRCLPLASVLARPGAVALRRPRVDDGTAAPVGGLHPSRRRAGHLHGDARAALEAVALSRSTCRRAFRKSPRTPRRPSTPMRTPC